MDKKTAHQTLIYRRRPYTVIGWREWVSLPELGIERIKAKIDTGARTSALHAFDIQPFRAHGKNMVRFEIHPLQRNDDRRVHCKAELVDLRRVRNSGAYLELRYVIKTTLILAGIEHCIEITLTNRSLMTYRMLLGRKALQQHYIIDPSRSFRT